MNKTQRAENRYTDKNKKVKKGIEFRLNTKKHKKRNEKDENSQEFYKEYYHQLPKKNNKITEEKAKYKKEKSFN